MCSHVDLQHLRVFRIRHHRGRLSTDRADQRFFRQRDELLHNRQVEVVAPTVAGVTGLRAPLPRGRRGLCGIEQIIGTIALGRLLRPAAKKLVLQDVDLTARLFKLFGQLFDALDGLGMLTFPIADFPVEIPPQLLQRPLQTFDGRAVEAGSRRSRRLDRKVHKRGIHRATL
jgi:hypothetical protein